MTQQASIGSLAAALEEGRRRGFVGRGRELAAFDEVCTGPARLLYVHGQGGIGKSTLLDACARRAAESGLDVVALHARAIDAAPKDFLLELAAARRSGPPEGVLLVDGYGLFADIDDWFRSHFVPELPDGWVTVLASRAPPASGWQLDPGWRPLVRVVALGELDPDDSAELLRRTGVVDGRIPRLVELGRGHPLALAMLAEAARSDDLPGRLADAPDLVSALCGLLVDDVPDAAHRVGLATCAHLARTTEDLLIETVGARAAEVWRWLASRPYVRYGEGGLYLHDLVRDVFESEFRHRSPAGYEQLHRTIRVHLMRRLLDPSHSGRARAAADLLVLHVNSPLVGVTDQLKDRSYLPVTRGTPADSAEILSLVDRFEGPANADLARRWIDAQPAGLYTARSDRGVEGFALHLYLPGEPELAAADPVTRAADAAIAERGPLRPGEQFVIGRFLGGPDGYQRASRAFLVGGTSAILEWTSRPAAWTLLTATDPDYLGVYYRYLGMSLLARVHDGFAEVFIYGVDNRRLPMDAMFEMLGERELTGEIGPPPARLLGPAPLSRTAFDAAVRDLLREFGRPDRLADNPLLTGNLVDPASPDRTAAIRDLVRRTVSALAAEPDGDRLRAVLERTFFKGVPSQEAAAELLDLPLSTYRRQLARATDRLLEMLWAVEIGRSRPLPGVVPSRTVAADGQRSDSG